MALGKDVAEVGVEEKERSVGHVVREPAVERVPVGLWRLPRRGAGSSRAAHTARPLNVTIAKAVITTTPVKSETSFVSVARKRSQPGGQGDHHHEREHAPQDEGARVAAIRTRAACCCHFDKYARKRGKTSSGRPDVRFRQKAD